MTTSDPNGTTVTYTATVSDTVDPSPSLDCVPPSGSLFAVGATTVTPSSDGWAGAADQRQFINVAKQ